MILGYFSSLVLFLSQWAVVVIEAVVAVCLFSPSGWNGLEEWINRTGRFMNDHWLGRLLTAAGNCITWVSWFLLWRYYGEA